MTKTNQGRLPGSGMEEILKWGEGRKEILGREDSMSNGTKMGNRGQCLRKSREVQFGAKYTLTGEN